MTEARIYIADQRNEKVFASGWIRNTLNFDDYQSEYRAAIGKLHAVNEWGGNPNTMLSITVEAVNIICLLPLFNGIKVQFDRHIYCIPVGELIVMPIKESTILEVTALEDVGEEFVFQQFIFQDASDDIAVVGQFPLRINASGQKNEMITVLPDAYPFQLYIGAFYGKEESILSFDGQCESLFVYTLDGSFEVEERLLFRADSLYLANLEQVEVECLSSTGLIIAMTV